MKHLKLLIPMLLVPACALADGDRRIKIDLKPSAAPEAEAAPGFCEVTVFQQTLPSGASTDAIIAGDLSAEISKANEKGPQLSLTLPKPGVEASVSVAQSLAAKGEDGKPLIDMDPPPENIGRIIESDGEIGLFLTAEAYKSEKGEDHVRIKAAFLARELEGFMEFGPGLKKPGTFLVPSVSKDSVKTEIDLKRGGCALMGARLADGAKDADGGVVLTFISVK